MRDFVNGYYALLPSRASEAWNRLDVGYQQRAGHGDYLSFWSTIRSVTVLSVRPRDATSVVANLRYVTNSGSVSTENRWLRIVSVNGVLLIGDSDLVG
jgi:serine/threonine-protein kinase